MPLLGQPDNALTGCRPRTIDGSLHDYSSDILAWRPALPAGVDEGKFSTVHRTCLRNLERDGLLSRTITPSVPVQVDYELTPLGHGLLQIVLSLKSWAEANVTSIENCRRAYDLHDTSEEA
jgi:hypothetical protein